MSHSNWVVPLRAGLLTLWRSEAGSREGKSSSPRQETSRWGWDIGAAKPGAASCRGGGRDFDPQRAAASVAERRVVDRACGEHEDQVPLAEEGDGVTRP